MELELWAQASAAIAAVATRWPRHLRDRHSTALIVRVYHWAALHDRPICWACDPANWTQATRPSVLLDQSTMSRRTRRADFERFLQRVGQRLYGPARPAIAPAKATITSRRIAAGPSPCWRCLRPSIASVQNGTTGVRISNAGSRNWSASGLLRLRPGPVTDVGSTHLASPSLGHEQVADQRRPHPHQPKKQG